VDGTTGYEHIRVTEHALLDPAAEAPLTASWNELTGDDRPFDAVEDAARREVLAGGLRPDLDRLVRLVIEQSGEAEVSAGRWRAAIVELTIGLHRYRTYLPDDADSVVELQAAHDRAVAERPDLADDVGRFTQLVRRDPVVAERWQQLTSPVMAKGAEDRAFYRYLRLAALCEVGGAPGQFTLPVEEFHEHQRHVQSAMPITMLAGTTHDTKRSEGVRARALALAEIADDWTSAVRAWFTEHGDLLRRNGLDASTTLLALETAVTAWPIATDRLLEYLVKSTREADEHTSWTDPDPTYEDALERLADVVAGEFAGVEHDGPAGSALAAMLVRTLRPGWARSLATLLVRLTAPGVPDLYQGTVAFTYSLVDPDNRVEPDWDERRTLVDRARALDGPAAWLGDEIEAAKAVVVTRALALRRRRPAAFGREARYVALDTTGAHADRVLAFARADDRGPQAVTVVTMHEVADWADTAVSLPSGPWRNVLEDDGRTIAGGAPVRVTWLDRFPVALLEKTAI
jgi:(1->4)-alpha-D-glucan 1-alpha-D-glucosylmutase